MTPVTPVSNHWVFTFPDREPILSPYRSKGGFRENFVRTCAGRADYLSPFFSQWWEFQIGREDLVLPRLARVTLPAEQFTYEIIAHEIVALVGVKEFSPRRRDQQILRVVDGRTWHATGRGADWPPLPIPIPDDWPIFGVREAGAKAPEIKQSMDELDMMLRAELGDLKPKRFTSEGGIDGRGYEGNAM